MKRDELLRVRGVTLVELLAIIAVVGVLLAFMLPAVRAAGEAARGAQCQNQLKQIATAILLHEEAQGHFPTGGWGNEWVGDPDRGFGVGQPGGWIYNSLPYLEESQLRDVGKGSGDAKPDMLARLLGTPISVLNCPSRRQPKPKEYTAGTPLRNARIPPRAAKNDYAICGGDVPLRGGSGPASPDFRELRSYKWPSHDKFSGMAFVLSTVRLSQVTDGATQTYLVGEKLLHGESEQNWGDDQTLYVGDDADVRRWTASARAATGATAWTTSGSAVRTPWDAFSRCATGPFSSSRTTSIRRLTAGWGIGGTVLLPRCRESRAAEADFRGPNAPYVVNGRDPGA